MKASQSCINLIKQFEGLRLKAYKCVPTEKMYTIGYGHYGVEAGMTITKEEAEAILVQDLEKFEKRVMKYDPVYHFNQNQFDALVSFAYNVGSIDKLTAGGLRSIPVISTKMLDYNKSGGKVLKGLTRRRKLEQQLFNTPVFTAMPEPVEEPQPTIPHKSVEEIAKEVIRGKWGNGATRKKLLTDAGYDYYAVQCVVNQSLNM